MGACNLDEFYEYHQQWGHATKYYVMLLNKIQGLIDQNKVAFLEPKLDNKPKPLRGPQHEKNKTMGIFNNLFLIFFK